MAQPRNTQLRASLELLLEEWSTFNLDGLREVLDAQASEIGNKQDASAEARKTLADQTQLFRKQPSEAKLKGFGALLKLYQDEIDHLTRRGAFAEKSFLSLYRQLAEIPDPVPALAKAIEDSQQSAKLADLDAENKRLQKELAEFHKEHLEVQNREVTIRRLEEKNREYERKMEDIIEERIYSRELAMREDIQKEAASTQERESELERQLASANEELRRARRTNEDNQAQLFDAKHKFDEELQAKQLQIDILINESERASATIVSLNQEKNKLKDRLKGEQQPAYAMDTNSQVELELQVAQKEIEISRLNDHIHELEAAAESARSERDAQLAVREAKIRQQTGELEALNKKLQQSASASAAQSANKQKEKNDLSDQTVRERNRRLETEQVRMKAQVEELSAELKDNKAQLTKAQEKVSELSKLVIKLEEDIANSSTVPDNPLSIDKGVASQRGSEGALSMTDILCSQRDRFKARVSELEAEARRLRTQLSEAQNVTSELKSDNVKLYEKMRYLQSYNNFKREAKEVPSRVMDSDIENRYKGIYEETVNPFVLFNRKEKQDRYKELNTAEKVTLRTGQFFLANKFSRTFIFVYTLALHLLVFLTLYKLASVRTVVVT